MNWFSRFWYQDLPNEMQRKMLAGISSNRPNLDNFVRRSVKRWQATLVDDFMRRRVFLASLDTGQRSWK